MAEETKVTVDFKGVEDETLVRASMLIALRINPDHTRSFSVYDLLGAIIQETKRRGWPEGWWEDPSVVLDKSEQN